MAVISQDTDERYWIVTDSDARDDGKFDINLKQVKDFQGTPLDVRPAPRHSVTRNQDVTRGAIIKVTTVTQVDRTIVVNPVS